MEKRILIIAVSLIAAACSKDKPPETARAEQQTGMMTNGAARPVDVNAIRATLLREYPDRADVIRGISISESDGIVMLSGMVHDERAESELVGRVRRMEGVRDVQSDLRRHPQATGQLGQPEQARTVEEVRMLMLQERPNDSDIIRGLSISSDGGVVTLEGRVYDEKMKSDLTRAAKKGRGVSDVKDNLKVDESTKPNGRAKGGSEGSPEAIRAALHRDHPTMSTVIDDLKITDEDDTIVLKGNVPDEMTKKRIMDSAKKASAKKRVRGDLDVKNKKK